jgi:hypothetical protein
MSQELLAVFSEACSTLDCASRIENGVKLGLAIDMEALLRAPALRKKNVRKATSPSSPRYSLIENTLIHDLTHSLGLADSQNLRFSLALPA